MGSSAAVDPARIHRLRNPVQHYSWGSRTAIPELLGKPSPAAEPWAELWMGAHPVAPSEVEGPDGREPLDVFIARNPEAVLGAEVAARFAGRLPFLFKVLAAAEPLSIQAHPGPSQAREGFERENRAGLALDAPQRCYRDANHKPELICALTPFHALNRFREPGEIADRIAALGEPVLEAPAAALRDRADRDGLAAFFETVWTLSEPARARAIASAVRWAGRGGGADRAAHWVSALAGRYPSDIGVLAPLLLNVVELAPGEAMFLGPGELHAYLEGVGIEIMANSDNVLRGGLTRKHVDVRELLRTLAFRAGPIERLRARAVGSGESCYDTPAEEFALGVVEVRPDRAWTAARGHGIEILLCTAGSGRIAGAGVHAVARGDCFVVPAAAPAYVVEGSLTLFRAASGVARQAVR
jgi:mannose-6-phosphate isomerase